MTVNSSLAIPVVLILIGLGGLLFITYDSPGILKPVWGGDLKTSFQSNGERIYYIGYNEQGQRIRTTQGPMWLYMHGGSCVDCHGIDGRGGVPIMMGTVIPSDITYEALTADVEHGEDELNEEIHPPYTNETIKIAIREGINPAGESLDPTMPRWQMSDNDIDDLLEYLKTL